MQIESYVVYNRLKHPYFVILFLQHFVDNNVYRLQ